MSSSGEQDFSWASVLGFSAVKKEPLQALKVEEPAEDCSEEEAEEKTEEEEEESWQEEAEETSEAEEEDWITGEVEEEAQQAPLQPQCLQVERAVSEAQEALLLSPVAADQCFSPMCLPHWTCLVGWQESSWQRLPDVPAFFS